MAFGFAGGWEWIVILIVALLIFGKRLPDLARSLGKSLTEFKKGIKEVKDTKDDLMKDVNEVKNWSAPVFSTSCYESISHVFSLS